MRKQDLSFSHSEMYMDFPQPLSQSASADDTESIMMDDLPPKDPQSHYQLLRECELTRLIPCPVQDCQHNTTVKTLPKRLAVGSVSKPAVLNLNNEKSEIKD
ncbi:hypothetical protein TNCV_5121131 [Trichonephila clavipes]|nr:hypothetical protein TNCV_5121131 [Trichonephila clavipes]